MGAPGDPRWRIGCSHIEDAYLARNIILPEGQVGAIIGAACRAWPAGVPMRVVAALHDTSVEMIARLHPLALTRPGGAAGDQP
jgi:hypothetical protein